MMKATMKSVIIGLLSLMLTGCFVSNEPLIGPEEAAYPLAPGQYNYFEGEPDNPDAGYRLEWQGDISIKNGVYATSVEPDDFPYQDSYFTELEDGIWIAQHVPDPGDEGYFYTLLHAAADMDNRYYVEWVTCEPLGDDIRAELGLVLEDDEVCEFFDLDTLKAGMRAWLSIRDDIEDLGTFPEGYSYFERVE